MLAQLSVTTDQDIVDLNDGQTSLREAIFATNIVPGADEIVFDFSHDGPATIRLTQGELLIRDSLTITGPGAQLLAIDASGSDPTPDVNNGDGSRVFKIEDGVNSTPLAVAIEGLTITGGDTSTSGGGISNRENLTLREVVVKGNSMFGVRQYGGGVFAGAGTLTIVDCQIIGNSTPNYAGGGVAVDNGTLIVSDSRIAENRADLRAGGIDASSSHVTITDSIIEGNIADGSGGGLSISQGTFLMQRSTVRGNSSTHEGGGLSLSTEQGTIVDSAVVGNTATVLGGGIRALTRDGVISISQSTISENQAPNGSALLTYVSTATGRIEVRHSTLSANNALDADGAAVFAVRGKLVINHSIVAGNAQESQPEFELAVPTFPTSVAPSLDVHYSLIGDSAGTNLGTTPVGSPDAKGNVIGGGDLGAIDPLLGPLADNGGPTLTHALLPGSPATNAGSPSPDNFPECDQRGEPYKRIFGARVDMGAYERQSFVVDTLVDESDQNFGSGDLSLREAIQLANLTSGVDTIEFSPILTEGTIFLTIGQLNITDSVEIVGLGRDGLTIDNSKTQGAIFNVDNNSQQSLIVVSMSGLTLTGSKNSAIRSVEDLTVDGLRIRDNISTRGGGINVDQGNVQVQPAELTVHNTEFINNLAISTETTLGGGGGINFSARGGELHIDNSVFTGNTAASRGGGVSVNGYSNLVTIVDSTFEKNSAFIGGGISISDDNSKLATLEHVALLNNVAATAGGGLYIAGKPAEITDCVISGNRAEGAVATQRIGGGGIFKTGFDTLTIRSSTISGNHSNTDGGAMNVSNSLLKLIESKIEGNSAAARGGGIFASGGSETEIGLSTISGNSSGKAGGGLYFGNLRGRLQIVGSTFDHNQAESTGGGMHIAANNFLLSNSTISTNSARQLGGGIYIGGVSTNKIQFSTLVLNESGAGANFVGTGPSIFAATNFPINLDHTISAANRDLNGLASDIAAVLNESYSLRYGAEFLGPLADNGGPTKTHALLPGSSAIDAGDPTLVAGSNGVPQFDQRGEPFTRVFGGRVDIGAYESQSLIVDTLVDENDGDYSQGDFSLREAIDLANKIAGANKIEFSSELAGGTILIAMGEYAITDVVEIVSLGSELLTIDAQQQSRIFNVTAKLGAFAFSGMTLTKGSTSANVASFGGGAIYSNSTGLLTLDDVHFVGNRTLGADARGGAVYVTGNLNVQGSQFKENSTTGNNAVGGAVYAAGDITLTTSTFTANQTAGSNASGGAVFTLRGILANETGFIINRTMGNGSSGGAINALSLAMADSTVSGNSTYGLTASGGAINLGASRGGDIPSSMVDSFIIENYTIGTNSRGGGLSTTGTITVERSTISGNITFGGNARGGGLYASLGILRDSAIAGNRTYGPGSLGGGVAGGTSKGWQVINSDFLLNQTFATGSSGGALAVAGDVSVVGSRFQDNSAAAGGGGAIFTSQAGLLNLSISSSSFTGNSASFGGAIASQINATIVDSVLSNNRATGGFSGGGEQGGGGAINQSGAAGTLTITRSRITDNHALGQNGIGGGGIRAAGRTTIIQSEISNNRVIGQGGRGGGVFIQGPATITETTISGNQIIGSGGFGGGAFLASANVAHSILNSTISGNQVTGDQTRGGGLYSTGRLDMRHTTVTDNRVNSATGQAGGLWVTQSQTTVSHSILAGNFVGITASDLRGQPQLSYSLVGTKAGTEFVEAPVGSPNDHGNFIGGPIHGIINPLLGPLANNGGPTLTHALLAGSPADNAGNPALRPGVDGTPLFDQRGVPFGRVVSGRIDIGAFESQPAAGAYSGDFDGDGDVDGRDFLAWQRGYGLKGPKADRSRGDATGDQLVNGIDLAVWQVTYGEEPLAISSHVSTTKAELSEATVGSARNIIVSVVPTLAGRHLELRPAKVNKKVAADEAAVDRAFDHWLPQRRFSDIGDIVTHRHVRRRDFTAARGFNN